MGKEAIQRKRGTRSGISQRVLAKDSEIFHARKSQSTESFFRRCLTSHRCNVLCLNANRIGGRWDRAISCVAPWNLVNHWARNMSQLRITSWRSVMQDGKPFISTDETRDSRSNRRQWETLSLSLSFSSCISFCNTFHYARCRGESKGINWNEKR